MVRKHSFHIYILNWLSFWQIFPYYAFIPRKNSYFSIERNRFYSPQSLSVKTYVLRVGVYFSSLTMIGVNFQRQTKTTPNLPNACPFLVLTSAFSVDVLPARVCKQHWTGIPPTPCTPTSMHASIFRDFHHAAMIHRRFNINALPGLSTASSFLVRVCVRALGRGLSKYHIKAFSFAF